MSSNNNDVVIIQDTDESDTVLARNEIPPHLHTFASGSVSISIGDATRLKPPLAASMNTPRSPGGNSFGSPQRGAESVNDEHLEKASKMFYDNFIDDVFERFDADHGGTIDATELEAAMMYLGHCLTPEQVRELLLQVDVDGNNSLDRDEFRTLIKLWMDAAQFKVFDDKTSVSVQHIKASVNNKAQSSLLDDSYWRWAWYLVLMFVATYFWVSIFILYNWLDDDEGRKDMELALLPSDSIATLVLLAEMVFRSRMAFLDEQGNLVNDKKLIFVQYLKTWFVFDLITMVPFSLMTTNATASIVLRHLRLLLVPRMPYLFNESKLMNITISYISFHYSFLPLFRYALWFLCAITTLSMIHLLFMREAVLRGDATDEEASLSASFYWTLYVVSGVGYGDIVPQNNFHRWYAIFLFVVSWTVNGLFVGGMVTWMQEADVESTRRTKLVMMQAVLRFFDVPEPLQEEILQFQDHLLKTDVSTSYSQITDMLPKKMQENIFVQSRVPLLRDIELFSVTHLSTLVQIANKLFMQVFTPEEYIATAGEKCDVLCILNYGFVDVMSRNGTYLTTIKRGTAFGERGLLVENEPFSVSFKSLTFCDSYLFSRTSLLEIMGIFPKFKRDIEEREVPADHYLLMCPAHELAEFETDPLPNPPPEGKLCFATKRLEQIAEQEGELEQELGVTRKASLLLPPLALDSPPPAIFVGGGDVLSPQELQEEELLWNSITAEMQATEKLLACSEEKI